MLNGFSRILDIQKFSAGGGVVVVVCVFGGGGGLDPQTPLEIWDTWSEPSFYKTFLLTTTTSHRGGGGGLLILES